MISLVSVLLFAAISTTISFFLCMISGTLTTTITLISFILGVLVSAWFFYSQRKTGFTKPTLKDFDYLIIFFFILFTFRQFLWIYYPIEGRIYSLNNNNLGDLPLHLTYIKSFLNGFHFWPVDPIYAAEKLHYPFGVDLFTAMFVKLGASIESVLPLMGVAASLLTMIALFWWGRGFAMAGFIFSGGLAGLEFFTTGVLRDYLGNMAWKNLVLTLFVPQRGFLMAFSVGLVLLWSWRRRFLTKEKSLPQWVEGVLWGTLPLFHFHTFLFLSVIFAIWSVASKKIPEATKIFSWAVIPAAIESLFLTGFFSGTSLIWFKPTGWMIGSENIFSFFFKNYGLWIPLTFAALYFAIKKRNRQELLILIPALSMYVIFLFVIFAPWEWDNTKLMVWCYLLILPVLAEVVEKLHKPWRFALYFWLFFSGFISLASYFSPTTISVELFQLQEIDTVCHALKNLPSEAPVATVQIYNHPVSLCGHQVVAGYGGHLWSHGIKSAPTEEKLKRLMMGESDWQRVARELKARYIFWGHREKQQFSASPRPWEQTKLKVAEGEWGQVYDLGEQQ